MTLHQTHQVYLSRYSNQVFITPTPWSPALNQDVEGEEVIRKLQLDHLQSNLKRIKSDYQFIHPKHPDQPYSVAHQQQALINRLSQLNPHSSIPLTLQEFHTLNQINQYHSNPPFEPIIQIIQLEQEQKTLSDLSNQSNPSSQPIVQPIDVSTHGEDPHIQKNQTISTAHHHPVNSNKVSSPSKNNSSFPPSSPIISNSNSLSPVPLSSATIFQKNQILDWYYSNGKNQTQTAKHFQSIYPELRIKQPLISSWLKHEQSIRAKRNHVNQNVKRVRTIQYPKIDDQLGEWVQEALNRDSIITDNLLREKWREFARLENIPVQDWLHLSHGWLTSFKVRKGLKEPRLRDRRKSSCSHQKSIIVPPTPETSENIHSSTPSLISHKYFITDPSPDNSHVNHDRIVAQNISSTDLQVPTNFTQSESQPDSAKNSLNPSDHQNKSKAAHDPSRPEPIMTDFSKKQPSQSNWIQQTRISSPIRALNINVNQNESNQTTSNSNKNNPPAPTTANDALNSIETLLNYLPTTITITSNETQKIIHLINSLNDYKNQLVDKINFSDINTNSCSSTATDNTPFSSSINTTSSTS